MNQNTRNKLLLTTVLLMSASAGTIYGADAGFLSPTGKAQAKLRTLPTDSAKKRETESAFAAMDLMSPVRKRMLPGAIKKNLAALQRERDELNAIIAEKARESSFASQIAALETEHESKIKSISALQAQMTARYAEASRLASEKTAESQRLSASLAELTANLEAARKDKDRIDAELAAATEGNQEALERQRKENKSLTEQIEQILSVTERDLDDNLAQLEQKNQECIQYRAERAKLDRQLRFEKAKTQRLEEQLRAASVDLSLFGTATSTAGGSGEDVALPTPAGGSGTLPPPADGSGEEEDDDALPPSVDLTGSGSSTKK